MKEIPLTRGKVAIVDDEDYEKLRTIKWHSQTTKVKGRILLYAAHSVYRREGSHKVLIMHRLITNCPKGLEVDHIDGDGLNNQKSNLRVVTRFLNQQNRHGNKTSKYTGVYYDKQINKWRAQVQINGKRYDFGLFDTEEEAHTKREGFVSVL